MKILVISPLLVFTPEGTIGLPCVRPSALSAKNLDPLIALKLLKLGACKRMTLKNYFFCVKNIIHY